MTSTRPEPDQLNSLTSVRPFLWLSCGWTYRFALAPRCECGRTVSEDHRDPDEAELLNRSVPGRSRPNLLRRCV